MLNSAREQCLATSVMTASREKLHLMLIEAALRLVERALQQRQTGREEDSFTSVLRAREVVNELICGMKDDATDELTRRVAAIYVFIFRKLVEAGYPRQQQPLEEAIRILRIERETWRQVCGQNAPAGAEPPAPAPTAPSLPQAQDACGAPEGGFSLEA